MPLPREVRVELGDGVSERLFGPLPVSTGFDRMESVLKRDPAQPFFVAGQQQPAERRDRVAVAHHPPAAIPSAVSDAESAAPARRAARGGPGAEWATLALRS